MDHHIRIDQSLAVSRPRGCTASGCRGQRIAYASFKGLDLDIVFILDFHDLRIDPLRKIVGAFRIFAYAADLLSIDLIQDDHTVGIAYRYAGTVIFFPAEVKIFMNCLPLWSGKLQCFTVKRKLVPSLFKYRISTFPLFV